jgi:hypothetical protein
MQNQIDIFQKIIDKGNDLYQIVPKSVRWLFWPFKFIYKVNKLLRLDLWIISGKENSSGQELSIIYAGRTTDKNYFIDLIFGNCFKQNYIGRKWLWNVLKTTKQNNQSCSISIVETSHKLIKLSKKMNCFYIPSWISGQFDMPLDKDYFIKKNTSIRSDIKKIDKNQLSYAVTRDVFQLENYYYNMHVPFIKKAFGDRAYISDYNEVKRDFIKQTVYKDLLLIKKDNDYIAGSLLDYNKKLAKIVILGIKEGNYEYVKDGAIGAIYYFSILFFEKLGCKRIELGLSRPFLEDGVLRYKRKWGQTLIPQHMKSVFMVKMLSETEGLKGFFVNNPFIYEDASGLNGAVFVENNRYFSEKDFKKLIKDYYQPGISKLVIYKFDKSDSNTFTPVPAELSDKVEVRSVYSVFGINPRD